MGACVHEWTLRTDAERTDDGDVVLVFYCEKCPAVERDTYRRILKTRTRGGND